MELAASTFTGCEGSMLEKMINDDIGTGTTEYGYIRLDISPILELSNN